MIRRLRTLLVRGQGGFWRKGRSVLESLWSWFGEKTGVAEDVRPAGQPGFEALEPRVLLNAALGGMEPDVSLAVPLYEQAVTVDLHEQSSQPETAQSPILILELTPSDDPTAVRQDETQTDAGGDRTQNGPDKESVSEQIGPVAESSIIGTGTGTSSPAAQASWGPSGCHVEVQRSASTAALQEEGPSSVEPSVGGATSSSEDNLVRSATSTMSEQQESGASSIAEAVVSTDGVVDRAAGSGYTIVERTPATEYLFADEGQSDGVIIFESLATDAAPSDLLGSSEVWWDWSGTVGIPDGPNGDWVGINCNSPTSPPDNAYVTEVKVHHEITHTYIGDLECKVYNTQHSWMVRDNEGGSADNINEDRWQYGLFDGDPVKQAWYYRVRDTAGSDTGTLTVMQLYVYYDVPKPDLTKLTDNISQTSAKAGDTLTGTLTITNAGQSGANAGYIYYYWSRGAASYDPSAKFDEDYYPSLGVSATDGESFTFTVPSDAVTDTYYLSYGIDATQTADESNEDNNRWYWTINVTGKPDLTKLTDNISQTIAEPGDTLNITLTIINSGGSAANGGDIWYYWSQGQPSWDVANLIGGDYYPALAVNGTDDESFSYTVPTNATTDTYCLSYWIDVNQTTDESNENNNRWYWNIAVHGNDYPDIRVEPLTLNFQRSDAQPAASAAEAPGFSSTTDPDSISLAVQFESPLAVDSAFDGQHVRMEGLLTGGNPGDPELPFLEFRVLLPPEADLSTVAVDLDADQWETLAGQYDVAPVSPAAASQEDRVQIAWGDKDAAVIVDGRDVTTYTNDGDFPGRPIGQMETSSYYYLLSVRFQLWPVRYNPVQRRLEVLRAGVVRVSFASLPTGVSGTEGRSLRSVEDLVENLTPAPANRDDVTSLYAPTPPTDTVAAGPSAGLTDYVIITTSQIQSNSTQLAGFVSNQQTKGHTVAVVVEGSSADGSHYLSGTSCATRSANIRQWLRSRYTAWGVPASVVLVGNPDPSSFQTTASVPMAMCYPNSADHGETCPTDMFYAEVSNSWDVDGDGFPGEWGDDFVAGGIDRDCELEVGRIPFYGSYTDLDSILQKTRSYESVSGTPSWRQKLLIPAAVSNYAPEDHNGDGDAIDVTADDREFATTNLRTFGADWGEAVEALADSTAYSTYTLYEKSGCYADGSAYPLTANDAALTSANVLSEWQKGYGFVTWWGHGSESGAYRRVWQNDSFDPPGTPGPNDHITQRGLETSDIAFMTSDACAQLNDSYPSIVVQVSCHNGRPESSTNLAYSLLRHGAVATVSATRVSWYAIGAWSTGLAGSRGDNASYAYTIFQRMAVQEDTAARALNHCKADFGMGWEWSSWMNCLDFNLYGDPGLSQDGGAGDSFTIYNEGAAALDVSAIAKESGSAWLDFSPQAPFRVPAGGSQTVAVTVDPTGLPAGQYSDRLLVYSNDPDESPYPGGVYVNLTAVTNDDFADRVNLGSVGSATVTGRNVSYTGEPGEPAQSGTIHSAWWSWTAPANGALSLNTNGSDFDTYLTLATGSAVSALTVLAQDDDGGEGLQSLITRTVAGGTQYQIAVDGAASNTGHITLRLSLVENRPPTDIALSNAGIPENQPSGTTVGAFSTTDPDSGNTFTYTLVGGIGSTDNGSFTISGSNLRTAAVFDYETQNSYSVRVRSTDQGSLWTEKAFTINVTNVGDDIALAIAAADATKAEGNTGSSPSTPFTFTVTRTGLTTGTTTVYYAVTGSGSNAADAADFVGGLLPGGRVDFTTGETGKTITVHVYGDTTPEPNEGFTVTLSNASGGAQITTPTATGTIQNDDTSGNLALGRPATASTSYSGLPASNATDGSTTSRWSSQFSNNEWIHVDLGLVFTISRIVLRWEAAYGRGYTLQVSNGASIWSDVYSTATGDGGVDDITLGTPASGRYVRMLGTQRATAYGYSLWEFEVYGGGSAPVVTVTVAPPAVAEDGAANLVYTFTRSTVSTSALTVSFSVGGAATYNADYTQTGAASFNAISGTVVIGANQPDATVTVDPTADAAVEPDETVILTATTGTDYTVGTPAIGTGTIQNDDGMGNLALGRPATASTSYTGLPASNVTDGNPASRWSSLFSNNEWISVDLGSSFTINRVVLRWEAAYGRGYKLQVSNDASTWSEVYSTATGDGGVDDITLVSPASGRYVRMLGTQRATAYGYSLWEFEVYGGGGGAPVVTVTVAPLAVAEDGAANLVYTFTRSMVSASALTVSFNVGGAATYNTDYTQTGAAGFSAASGTVVIGANQPDAAVTVDPTADTAVEPDETVILTVTAGTGYAVGTPSVGTGTIQNDDESGNLALYKSAVASTSYTGLPPSNATDGNVNSRWSSQFSESQWLYVDLGAVFTLSRVVLRWEAAYGRGYKLQVSSNVSTWSEVYSTTTGDGGVDDITLAAPASGRYVRLLGTQRATAYGYSLYELEVYAGAAPPNLALHKPATASTSYPGLPVSNATDGNLTSRWSSQFADSEWIYVDLGAVYTIYQVVLRWEAAYGRGYKLQVSSNTFTWSDVYSTTTGDGGVNDITLASPVSGRYVRLLGTQRATAYGYSLWECEVYG